MVSRGRGVRPFSNTCVPIIIMRFVCLFETGSDAAQHGLELLLVATSTSYLLGLHMCSAMLGLCGPRDWIPGYKHARPAFYLLNPILSPNPF